MISTRRTTMWAGCSGRGVVGVVLVAICASLIWPGSGLAQENRDLARKLERDPARVATMLAEADAWIMPQPKAVVVAPGTFDLAKCKGIRVGGAVSPKGAGALVDFPALLQERSGVMLDWTSVESRAGCISFDVFPDGILSGDFDGISAADLKDIGDQGYVLLIEKNGIQVAAREVEGLYYASRTLVQIAMDRRKLPCLKIRDWPALRYRGIQQDMSRGQVPTMETFKRLVRVAAEAKINMLEPYIEHLFKWKKHPDISPPEGITPQEGRAIFDDAARFQMEVHPLLQVLGHSGYILRIPAYTHLRIRDVPDKPWTITFDPRKAETIAFMNDLVQEIVATFPGKFLNVDITEVDLEGMVEAGMAAEDLPELVYQYVLKLRDMLRPHGIRLIIAQGPLDSVGHLSGMGPVLDKMPRDIAVGCYFLAGGVYRPARKKDFPRLKSLRVDFFSQAWIGSHIRLMPSASRAAEFSDLEVSRGLEHGAIGSTTCDWGDAGNYHLTGQTWYPFLYHGSSAWTGAHHDRGYFDQVFTRLLYGIKGDVVARGFALASDISEQKVNLIGDDGKVVERDSYHFWEFFQDPFTHDSITKMADPLSEGRRIIEPADEAVTLLEESLPRALRNRDNIKQLIFGARSFQTMGRKLVMVGHNRDEKYPREKLVAEMEDLVETYARLQAEFRRLWLAEDRENDNFHGLVSRFDNTIVPLRKKIEELKKVDDRIESVPGQLEKDG